MSAEDISIFFEEVGKENPAPHDTIANQDLTAIAATNIATLDYNNGIEDYYDPQEILAGLDVKPTDEISPEPMPMVIKPLSKAYPAEPLGTIDALLTTRDMMVILFTEIKRKRIAGHHLDSMNSFNKVGIKQIATKVFAGAASSKIHNLRDKTDEDKEIAEIYFCVDFIDINLTPPINNKYKSGTVEMLSPGMARIKNLTYSSQMFIDATITATATRKNGTTETRTAEIKNHRIASLPCMVGSELCITHNSSRESLKTLEEDPNDTGGYFIIKGLEWVIDNLENISNNSFHVFKNKYLNENARGTFLSKPGDAFENSYQVIIRYLNNGAITVEITTGKFDKFEIPYYLLFRAMGMTRDRDIINHIVYGVDNTDPITRSMKEILERAFDTSDDSKLGAICKSTDPAEIIAYMAQRISADTVNTAAARKDDNVAKYLNNSILSFIDRYFFPHIGNSVENRIKKLRFFGHLINKLLKVFLGILEPTDRDDYSNKSIFAAGTSEAKTFKTDFNIAVIHEVKKHLIKDFKSTPFSQVQLAESVKASINSDGLERMLVQAITSGNKTITVKRNEVTNRVSSQSLYRKNDMYVKSTFGTINAPNTSASKQNERADEMRRVHPSFIGYIDPGQSADTGEKVGMTKQMACTASICGASSSFVLKKILMEDPDIMLDDQVPPERITAEKLAEVFVNSYSVGYCLHAHELAQKYRTMRRFDEIHHLTTICWSPLIRDLRFWTDVGRMHRPLIIVYNNLVEYKENWRTGNRTMRFQQWIKLTKSHIRQLQAGTITMDDLRRERIIEYISPGEQEGAFLAHNITILREAVGDIRRRYTHCDIDQAILGLVTLASPMMSNSAPTRITYWTNHRKTAACWYASNYPYRIDKNVTLQHYCEKPLISVFSDALTYPTGLNTIVALMLHSGQNMEDSVIGCRSSIDCGAFNASFYGYEKAELDKGEQFGNPDYARTMDIKKDAVYEYVQNGFIAEGTMAQKGYVLIVKTAKIPKPVDQFQFVDKSIVYKRSEPVFIERVIPTRNDEDVLIVKVKYRANRPMSIGDKFSCLPADHQVLTTSGWKSIADITLVDKVATLVDGKRLQYVCPTNLHQYDHTGNLLTISTQEISIRSTINHRMYVAPAQNGPFTLTEAYKLVGTKHCYYKKDAQWTMPYAITHTDASGLITHMNDHLALLGASIIVCNEFAIKCNEYIEADRVDMANSIADYPDCVGKFSSAYMNTNSDYPGANGLAIGDHTIDHTGTGVIAQFANGIARIRMPEYVWDLGCRQARILLAALMPIPLANGANAGTNTCSTITVGYYHLAGDIMRLALHCGYSANIYVSATHIGSWAVYINKTSNRPVVHCTDVCITEPFVGKVYCLSVPSEVFLVRHNGKVCWTGNSRTGNKGIMATTWPRCDMPYTESGLTPDIIVNAHSIPTRMAINQVTECMLGLLAGLLGTHIDATAFVELDYDSIMALLKAKGIDYGGHQRMYNGRTGDWLDVLIFIGPTTYQRLQKFIIDEHYALQSGPTSALTRQPVEGRKNDGGLRIGEMEKDVLVSIGGGRIIFEKMNIDSDGIDLPICRICGNRAVINEKKGIYKCKICGDNADIVNVASCWVANVFFHEANAMGIKMEFEISPHTYTRMEA